jgi:hypothetical protein
MKTALGNLAIHFALLWPFRDEDEAFHAMKQQALPSLHLASPFYFYFCCLSISVLLRFAHAKALVMLVSVNASSKR